MNTIKSIFIGLLIIIFCASPIVSAQAEKQEAPEASSKLETSVNKKTPQSPKTLRIIGHAKGQEGLEVFYKDHIKEFRFRHPDVEITYVDGKDLDLGTSFDKVRLAQYYAQMISSNDLEWDILWMDQPIYSRVADSLNDFEWGQKHLVDFSKIEKFNETQKAVIFNDPIYRKGTGGIIVGPYIEGYVGVAWYNQNLADRMGLNIKNYGMTFDDLLEYAQKVFAYNQKHGLKIALLADADTDKRVTLEYMFQNLIKSEIGDFDEARQDEISEKKLAALLKTLQALEKLAQYNPLLQKREGMSAFDAMWAVMEDKALFHIFGPWNFDFWVSKYGEQKTMKMTPAEMPVFKAVDFYLGGYLTPFAVLKNSPNKDLAVELLMSFTTARAVENYVRLVKTPTGTRGNLATFRDLGTDKIVKFYIEIDQKYQGRVHKAFNSGYLLGAKNKHLGIALDKRIHYVLEGKITASQAYEEIISMLK